MEHRSVASISNQQQIVKPINDQRSHSDRDTHTFGIPDLAPLSSTLIPCTEVDGGATDSMHDAEFRLVEKLDVDQDTVNLLTSIANFALPGPILQADDDKTSYRHLRLEEPVVGSDPETDVLRLRARNNIDTANITCAFQLELDGNQRPHWPSVDGDLPVLIKSERLDVNLTTLNYLRDIYSYASTDGEILLTPIKRERFIDLGSISPPQLRMSPPYIPDDPRLSVEGLPDMSTLRPVFGALADIEVKARIEGDLREGFDSSIDLEQFMIDDANVAPFLPPATSNHLQFRKLRVDSPVLPSGFPKSTPEPNQFQSLVSSSQSHDDSLPPGEPVIVLIDAIEHIAKLANQRLEQERLVDLDTVARIEIPKIQSPLPKASWKSVTISNKTTCDLELLGGDITWSGVTSLERQLPWSPFPTILGMLPFKDGPDSTSIDDLISDLRLRDNPDIEVLTSQLSEPILLKNYRTSEDAICPTELNCVHDEQTKHMVRKSPAIIQSTKRTGEHASGRPMAVLPFVKDLNTMSMNALLRKRKRELDAQEKDCLNAKEVKVDGLLTTDYQGLATFMKLQGYEDASDIESAPKQTGHDYANIPATVTLETPEIFPQHREPIPLPSPPILNPNDPYTTILSSKLTTVSSSSHSFLLTLQSLLPNLEIFCRDPPAFSHLDEADLTLSPSTGILLTTLQQLRQKPLPGRGGTASSEVPSFRSRITFSRQRFAKLYVLVTSGVPSSVCPTPLPPPDLSESDVLALNEFTSSLGNDEGVRVVYVGGKDTVLAAARWAAALISRCEVAGLRGLVGEDETGGERVSRCAGMNAFAARKVLGSKEGGEGGLGDFMAMGAEERVRKFAGLMGGRGLLGRVGDILDGGWMELGGR